MDDFETVPRSTIERSDGTIIKFYRSLSDPFKFRTEWAGAPDTWTEYFEDQMQSGNIKKS